MNITLHPHGAALARELEAEVQRLDTLQQQLIQQLVEELSDMRFLTPSDGGWVSARSTSVQPSAMAYPISACKIGRGEVQDNMDAYRDSNQPYARLPLPVIKRQFAEGTSSAASRLPAPLEAVAESACVAGAISLQEQHSRGEAHSSHRLTEKANSVKGQSKPLPQKSREEVEARRARRALRCILEERDAHVNAKVRRARELLKEGRDAVQRSRARRMAGTSATSKGPKE